MSRRQQGLQLVRWSVQVQRTTTVRSLLDLSRWMGGVLMMMMMPRVLLLLSSGSGCRLLSHFCCLDDKGGRSGVFMGVLCVLRYQASCFSLLVCFSQLEILLFSFRLCGCVSLSVMVVRLQLYHWTYCKLSPYAYIGSHIICSPHFVMRSRHRYRFILVNLMTYLQ